MGDSFLTKRVLISEWGQLKRELAEARAEIQRQVRDRERMQAEINKRDQTICDLQYACKALEGDDASSNTG